MSNLSGIVTGSSDEYRAVAVVPVLKDRSSTTRRRAPTRRAEQGVAIRKTVPCLWFDGQAEQAATLYTSR